MSSLVTQPRTLVDVLLPRQQRSWLLDATLVILFSAFVGLTAQVEIPLWPVPLTLQTLGCSSLARCSAAGAALWRCFCT